MNSPADNALGQILSLAKQQHQAGRLAEAEAGYRQILAADPNHAGAVYGLGMVAFQVEKWDVAVELIRRAIALGGDWPQGCYHLGRALQAKGEFDEAIDAYRRAIVLNPALFDAQLGIALCLRTLGDSEKALAAFAAALAIKPDDPNALYHYAISLQGAGRLADSIAALRRAVALKPDLADAFVNLGAALWETGEIDEALAAFSRARELAPRNLGANINYTAALRETGRVEEAVAVQRQVVAFRPDDADAHQRLGELLLLSADWAEGFAHYEWRWRQRNLSWPRRRIPLPPWDGGDLAGRTIYLHAEQSLGDTLQFIRFLPLVLQRHGKIVVECQRCLHRLFQGKWEVAHWFSPGDEMPAFDVCCPLLSLPHTLGISAQSLPGEMPYLRADPELSQAWWNKLACVSAAEGKASAAETGSIKVGLAWAGSPSGSQDRKRSLSLSQFLPLAGIQGVQYVSLQKGWAASQASDPHFAGKLADFTNELSDFADTAALINALDLVITVDTAVAHLAGAMGKPVWTLLPYVPHWRWMLSSEKTPWYPSMRLFRQSTRGDWADCIARVAGELTQYVVSGSAQRKSLADSPANP